MARIRLGRYEAEHGELPFICMRCGAPATMVKRKSLAWHPPWVYVLIPAGVLPFVIVAMVLTKRMRLQIPLCDAHKSNWLVRALIIWGSFVVFLGMIVLIGAVLFALDEQRRRAGSAESGFSGFLCLGIVGGAIAWLISIPIIQNTAIHVTQITDSSITLTKVSPRFVEAVRAKRQDLDEELYEGKARSQQQRRARSESEQYYDPNALRRRGPQGETGGEEEL